MSDCLILGGGVIGLSLAYDLAMHGIRAVVIDRADMGREASWAGAGILPPAELSTALDPLDRLRALSHDLHPRWAQALREETGIDTGYRRCGGIYLARQAGEAAALAGLAVALRQQKIEIQKLDLPALGELEPALLPLAESGKLRAAYWLPGEAQLRNPDHLRALVAACTQRGVELRPYVAAHDFVPGRDGRIAAIETSAGRLHAAMFCITSGAWTEALLRRLDVATGILPVRGQMVMFRTERPILRRILNEGPRYVVPRDDGRILVGSTEEEVGFDKSTTSEALDGLRSLAIELVPAIGEAAVERTWSGLRPGTFDGLPYLGVVPGTENVFVAAGHYRSGLYMSTGTATVMSRLLRGADPGIDLYSFRISRG